jgi:hypothetical protein
MKTAGHTILIAMKMEPGGVYQVTLECSCGRVFCTKNAPPHELEQAKSLVLADGREQAYAHIGRMNEILQTLGVKKARAA